VTEGLETGHIDTKGKVAVANLQRRGWGTCIATGVEGLNNTLPLNSWSLCANLYAQGD
jgi:hypothetical protein